MLRTHTCGELNEKNIAKEVTITGWVHSQRDHGDLIFIDLRDTYGITQIVFDPKKNKDLHIQAHQLKSEFVVKITGVVQKRPEGTENAKIGTGKIEILVTKLEILNPALTPPFEINDDALVSEETRLKYRYIDLRRAVMQKNLRLRYRITKIMRDYLSFNEENVIKLILKIN